MNISILLPYKENYSKDIAGAVSLFVKDTSQVSLYKNSIKVFGSTEKKNFLDKNYINLILDELVELNIQTWITNVNSDCIDKTWKSFKDIMFLNINDIKM